MQQPKFLKKKETTTSATTAKKKQKKGKTYIPGGFSTSAVPDNIEKYSKLSWTWNRVKQTSHWYRIFWFCLLMTVASQWLLTNFRQSYFSIPLENNRKPVAFLMFSGM